MTNSAQPALSFLIARPRSGTTWLQRAISQHPRMHCVEMKTFGGQFDVIKDMLPNGSTRLRKRSCMDSYLEAAWPPLNLESTGVSFDTYERDMTRIITRGIVDYVGLQTGAEHVVDKMTPVERKDVADRLVATFPEAKFAYLIRDGRDIAVSFLFDWLPKAHGASGKIDTESARFRRFVKREDVKVLRLFTDDEIADYAKHWQSAIEIFLPIASHRFSYEDMKADFPQVLRDYFAFLGVETTAADIEACCAGSSFEKMSGGAKEGDASRMSSATRRGVARGWVDYLTRKDAEIFEDVAGEALRQCGYEKDAQWVKELPAELQGFRKTQKA